VSVLVLVVDDEPDVEALFRQQFRRDLRAQRFVMDFAMSAADALARVASTIEQSLILILSDINMPGMTGLEMLPKVKEMRPNVPVIMITAYGDPETKRKAIESGATGLLTKPIDFTLLREEIDTRLQQANCLKNAGSLSALIMVSTMSAAPWSSRSSSSSHILRKLARIGAFSDGSRSIRVRAMQKAMPSVPMRACSTVGLLMAGSLSELGWLLALLLDQIAAQG